MFTDLRLKMYAAVSSKILIMIYQIMWCHKHPPPKKKIYTKNSTTFATTGYKTTHSTWFVTLYQSILNNQQFSITNKADFVVYPLNTIENIYILQYVVWQQISSLPLVLEHFPMWDLRFSWWRLNRIQSSGKGNSILQTSNACCRTHQNNFPYFPYHSPKMFLYILLYNAVTSTTPPNHVRMWR